MKAKDIAAMLARDAETICRMLLPAGKRSGNEWTAGDVYGAEGKSLSVRLSGDRAGLWADFADQGASGDLLDLWAQAKGISIADAIQEAKAYLGIHEPQFEGSRPRQYTRPDKPKCQRPQSAVADWLRDTRKLSDAAIAAYRLAEDGDCVIFPSLRDGELVRWKRRHREDKHKCQTSSDSEPCLFGWQAIPGDARQVLICEGEIDAVSWWQMGQPALSVPNGAQGHNWIECEYEHLERFDTIYLSMDNDDAGRKAVMEIVDRLGRERVRVIQIPDPWKDGNDLLQSGVDRNQVQGLIDKALTMDPAALKSAASFVDDVIREFYPVPGDPVGFRTPWEKVGSRLLFRQGEVTILAGANGHGKSEGACFLTLDALDQGERACIASMEFKPKRWLWRLVRQCGGLSSPAIPYIRKIHEWFNGKLWVFDVVGSAKVDELLSVFAYARRRYGVRLFVIDNLAKCGFDEDDYNGQKHFVDRLTDFAKEHDVHVMLVAHLRKSGDEQHVGGKMDVKGSGAITDMADTVLIWWRNKKKEAAREKADRDGDDFDEKEKPDAMLRCEKQRNGDDEPHVLLWFDRESHQFLEYANSRPKLYVEYSEGYHHQEAVQ